MPFLFPHFFFHISKENSSTRPPMSDDGSGDDINEQEEAEALGRIAHAIACYRSDASGEISRWEASAARLEAKRLKKKSGDGDGDVDDDPSVASLLCAAASERCFYTPTHRAHSTAHPTHPTPHHQTKP